MESKLEVLASLEVVAAAAASPEEAQAASQATSRTSRARRASRLAPVVGTTPRRSSRSSGCVGAILGARCFRGRLDAELLFRQVAARLQSQGNAEAERLRAAMRKAIALL